MRSYIRWSAAAMLAIAALVTVEAATVSRQGAEAFSKKVTAIRQNAEAEKPVGRKTPVSQDELNSWFTYSATPHLPDGVSQPQVTIVGQGRVAGQAIVDLEALAKRRSSGGTFDPWSLVGGRVPVNVTGVVHTRDGKARFEVQGAEISGLPVSPSLLQELVTFYSRTPERPEGVRIDDTFSLPAQIREIQVGQGQAVIVQ
jgi:hypothetical protein